MSSWFDIIGMGLLITALIILVPLAILWSFNILFHMGWAYSPANWSAVAIIVFILKSSVDVKVA